jgi:four helix bundle protein
MTDHSKEADAVVIQKTYDLLLWIIPQIEKFPRSYRFLLGDRIETKLLEIQDNLIEAYYTKQKGEYLKNANLKCEQVRLLIRLCKDLSIMGIDKYRNVSEKIDEIGKMIGGWTKTLHSQ